MQSAESPLQPPHSPDVLVAGAGIVGLALALELSRRGASVLVLDPRSTMRQASWAAAGMLAVEDPHHPPQLRALARASGALYPEFLRRVAALSGMEVPFQTELVIEYMDDRTQLEHHERSIDPRQLAEALPRAVQAAGIALHEDVGAVHITSSRGLRVQTPSGLDITPEAIVHTSGAWYSQSVPQSSIVSPRKGQIFRLQLPNALRLTAVHRRSDIYIVPRTQGPRRGTAVIGATVEDAGFDASIDPSVLLRMRTLAAELLPALADEHSAPLIEAWTGFRPSTPDGLPLMGVLDLPRQFVATGHFRNGILLAPASAQAMADLLQGRDPATDLHPFSPARLLLSR